MKRVVGAVTSSWSINTFRNVNPSIRQSSQSVSSERCGIDFDSRTSRNAAQFLLTVLQSWLILHFVVSRYKTFLWYIPEIIVHWEVCTWRKYQEGRARIIYLTFLSKLLDVKSSCKCISTLQMSIVGSNKIIKTSRTNEKWNSTLFCKHSHKYYLSNWKFPSSQAPVHHDITYR